VPVYDAFVAKPLTDAARDLLTRRGSYWPLTKEGELISTMPGSARVAAPDRPPFPRR
jgi:hypothetical protein